MGCPELNLVKIIFLASCVIFVCIDFGQVDLILMIIEYNQRLFSPNSCSLVHRENGVNSVNYKL